MRGLFFTFEGPEGSGKSTHVKLLYEYLEKKNFDVIKVREPGDTRVGEKIRRIILNPEYKEISPLTETLLYMASRNQLVEEVILPYLNKGYIVLCDRFLDSTIVYQGFALKVELDLIKKIANFVCKGITPDLTIVLDLPIKEGLHRVGKKPDRIEKRNLAFHRRVREGYFKLSRLYPHRIKIIPVEEKISVTQNKIRELILEKICLLNK
ncbi:MAG: dTMP kinase [Candidatus Omnitrophica bacterium]|nr:dTMP kinase [Candidatus Omnitrophota bacterium]